jgi:hypothetical protein
VDVHQAETGAGLGGRGPVCVGLGHGPESRSRVLQFLA